MKENRNSDLEIAVIGIAGLFPEANNIDDFWENIKEGKECFTFYTNEELINFGISSNLINDPKFVNTNGGIIKEWDLFDASFFGHTPYEAQIMDPQQRFFHEIVWHALENAGINPETSNNLIGVYAGASQNYLWELMAFNSGIQNRLISKNLIEKDYLATRISYNFNFKGPSFTIDTACSTSLVAVHLACQAVLLGECNIAIAGGASLSFSPDKGYKYVEGSIVSSDGHCRAFDKDASGTVPGQGVGAVVLKRLDNALKDGDHIWAVIKGTAINNDGKDKVSFYAPSIKGQKEVIKTAHTIAGIDVNTIGYIETHGTGTNLGDPIEIEALKQAFNTKKLQYCAIGSVKTNIGHLDAAAGVSGLIKTILMLKHKKFVPSLHFKIPNPKIDFKNSPFYVNTEYKDWTYSGTPRRAGVSSFGIGGTNAHVVLEEAPEPECTSIGRPFNLILLSAKTDVSLVNQRKKLLNYLQNNNANLGDVAYTLQVGRTCFQHRQIFVCSDRNNALESLKKEEVIVKLTENKQNQTVFMFSGQGSQYVGMAKNLYDIEPFFRREVDNCLYILQKISDIKVHDLLFSDKQTEESTGQLNQTKIAQPLLFVVEYSLAKLLIHWGIKPDMMIGHSIGEYVAACLAGVFSLEQGLRLIVKRGLLMQSMPEGSMVSIDLKEEEILKYLNEDITIAAINTSKSCVVSGTNEAVGSLIKLLEQQDILHKKLNTSHAFHSKMMDPILSAFENEFENISLGTPTLPFISNVTGQWITIKEATSPSYWSNHLRQTVRFMDGLTTVLDQDNLIFIETGPGKTLCNFVNQHSKKKEGHSVINMLRHSMEGVNDNYHLMTQLGHLWLNGLQLDWNSFYEEEKRLKVPLPNYPFDKQSYKLSNLHKSIDEIISVKNSIPVQIEDNNMDLMSNYKSEPVLNSPVIIQNSEIELRLVKIVKDFFGYDQVDINVDISELGVDSLKALSLKNIINKELSYDVPIKEFFNNTTIKSLSALISKSAKIGYAGLINIEKKEYYPVSNAQSRIFVLYHQMDQGSLSYNISKITRLEQEYDLNKLNDTIKKVIARHESLRTSFHIIDDRAVQIIHDTVEFNIEKYKITKDQFKNLFIDFIKPFSLTVAPLLRVAYVEIDEEIPVLFVDMHHIITDFLSIDILKKEVLQMYNGENLPNIPLQYKDYLEWRMTKKQIDKIEMQKKFWLESFPKEIPILELPYTYPRPLEDSNEGAIANIVLDEKCTAILKNICRSEDVSITMAIASIFSVLLSKLSGQECVIIGLSLTGRPHADLEKIIGMFVNVLPLITYPVNDKSYKEFIKEIKKQVLDIYENQDYQFDKLVEDLSIPRSATQNPIFNICINVLPVTSEMAINQEYGMISIYEDTTKRFDLTLNVFDNKEQLVLAFQFWTKLFDIQTIRSYIKYYQNLILSLEDSLDKPISDLAILSKLNIQEIYNKLK